MKSKICQYTFFGIYKKIRKSLNQNKEKKMKKRSLIFLLSATVCAQAAKDSGNATGKTFYSVRPLYQSAMPEKESLFYDRAFAKDCGWSGAIELVPFYSKTTKSEDLAKYFMYCGKTEFQVNNEVAIASQPPVVNREIQALHFNIGAHITDGAVSTFSSTISFRPHQSISGLGITWRQYIYPNCEKKWWLELSGPVYHVKNEMRLKETNKTGTPDPAYNQDMTEAFKGGTDDRDIKFGKINGARKKTGFADLEIKLGYDVVCEDAYRADFWLGALVPTGNKPKAIYVFEPIIGHNKHWGIIGGAHYGVKLWSDCDRSLNWEVAFAGKYLFKNDETRMLDLKFRPWSRYMLIYADQTAAAAHDMTNGSEVFTRKLQVTPRFQGDINSAFVYTGCSVQAEVGYNFWARQAEKVRLDKAWQEGPAVAEIINNGQINRLSNIGTDNRSAGIAYSTDTRIKESDLDLASATHPAAESHTIYGALGYRWDCWCWPTLVGFGGSYEFSAVNTAANRWSIWGKLGISI
jgi:hypothetical protein